MTTDTQKKPKENRGRRRVVNAGEWLTRSQIALRAGIDRETVSKYLALAGAPKPDAKMRFNYKAAMEWIGKTAPRVSAGNSEEMKTLRESLLRMEVEERGIELGVKKGQFIERAKIKPAIDAVMGRLTVDLQDVFERELPAKYHGHTPIECAELNAAGLDRVLKRMREGWGQIS